MKGDFVIILFYKFIHITDPKAFVLTYQEKCKTLHLTGRIIVAEEGINGTLEGIRENIETFKTLLTNNPIFADILFKESVGNGIAFPKLKIKSRAEVVTLGAGSFDIKKDTARELSASELESWYQKDEDFIVLDLRNEYEIASGRFEKTIDPKLSNFRDLPEKLQQLKNIKNKKIVTVCTGGIRCEKATCLLKKEGFTDLYQLKDGIHTYMKEYPGKNFKGTLFVFDNRLTTDVVPIENKVIVAQCFFCQNIAEKYYSDDRTRPSKKILCCDICFSNHKLYLREGVTVL